MSIEPQDFRDGDVQSDHNTEVSWYNDSAILHYNQREDGLVWDNDDWIDDDAVPHFDPDEQDKPLPRKPSPQLHTPSTVLNPASPTPQNPAGQGIGRKAAKPQPRKKKADVQHNDPIQLVEVDDVEFKSRMLDAIREDDELYHRILRYDVRSLHFCTPGIVQLVEPMLQPIPLEDFVALAVTLDFPIRGLQSKVTKFLDDQVCRCPSERIDSEP